MVTFDMAFQLLVHHSLGTRGTEGRVAKQFIFCIVGQVSYLLWSSFLFLGATGAEKGVLN